MLPLAIIQINPRFCKFGGLTYYLQHETDSALAPPPQRCVIALLSYHKALPRGSHLRGRIDLFTNCSQNPFWPSVLIRWPAGGEGGTPGGNIYIFPPGFPHPSRGAALASGPFPPPDDEKSCTIYMRIVQLSILPPESDAGKREICYDIPAMKGDRGRRGSR